MTTFWTFDKPVASLSTCHLGVLPWVTILFNLVICYGTALFEQLINIARFIEMLVRECECVSFNQVEVATHTYCDSLIHTAFNNLHSINNCLLCKNSTNESLW